ncbi:MAG TPA: ABC transporter ATP-binding protein [Candidatus Limnocylindria bacterium]|nr:ABC transporter ATP-binding protein [Candidatus Limnocylindria bacterium]
MQTVPLLTIDNITKTYHDAKQTVHALANVSLTINKGEIFGLLGVNGAGKTTLSSLIATLHPPTSGTILYKGESIYKNIQGYRTVLGFCPQTQNLDHDLTVEENLVFAGRYFLLPQSEIAQRVAHLMEYLELTRYKSFQVSSLSGGTKQRLLIARALIHNPEIVILDEPTVGLDPDIRRKLWTIITSLKERGITVILTTHYLDEAEALSDKICILHKGKVRLIESVQALKERHNLSSLEAIFLKLTCEYAAEQQ